jgi:phosphate starvation-inducible PhoH-like protein
VARKKNGNIAATPETTSKLLKEFKPKTVNQANYVRAISESDVIICTGPAGTGKTAVAIGLAIEHLMNGKIAKIVLTRPVIEAGRGMGFLPGTASEKLHPYLLPMLDELEAYLSPPEIHKYMNLNLVEVAALEHMRGRNFHQSYMVLDEAQNATMKQIKMFITRMGRNSKCIINGDLRQSDLERFGKLDLELCLEKLDNVPRVSLVTLTSEDIVRNPLIADILDRLES